jgi:uncharacterized iron-regulated membrane protein
LSALTIERDRSVSAAVATDRGTIYVDPYSGRVLGAGSQTAQRIFRALEDWHRWLAVSAGDRAWARAITGACNLGFLALAVSGLFLWWPRFWTVQHRRPILTFRRAATGRARDFNWHNVIGFWCAPAIIVMTATGVVMSYRWANDLVYRLARSTPPSANAGPRAAGAAGPEGRGGRGGSLTAFGGRGRGGEARGRTERAARPDADGGASRESRVEALSAADIDRAWATADARMPSWSVMAMRLPNRAGAPLSFSISDGASWNAFARSQLTVDAASGEVRQWQPYDQSSAGQKLRGWFRFAHTGELAGLTGQLIAGIASAGGAVLVWTGLALAVRRLLGWTRLRTLTSSRARAA